jgi:hypothetical protein
MTDFGFQPGILDYWMLLTDWRNGSFAILLALGVLLVGYAQAQRSLSRWCSTAIDLPQQLRQPGVTAIRRASSRVSTLAWGVVSWSWRKQNHPTV